MEKVGEGKVDQQTTQAKISVSGRRGSKGQRERRWNVDRRMGGRKIFVLSKCSLEYDKTNKKMIKALPKDQQEKTSH